MENNQRLRSSLFVCRDEKKKQVMDQVKAELALAQAHELINVRTRGNVLQLILHVGMYAGVNTTNIVYSPYHMNRK